MGALALLPLSVWGTVLLLYLTDSFFFSPQEVSGKKTSDLKQNLEKKTKKLKGIVSSIKYLCL